MKLGIHEQGIVAEQQARQWLMGKGITNLQQLDWLFKSNNKYFCVECKSRELFEPPPFWGTGMDKSQLKLRSQLMADLGIDTVLLVYETGTKNIYWQMLSKLEDKDHFDTKNNIRIYNIDSFHKEISF